MRTGTPGCIPNPLREVSGGAPHVRSGGRIAWGKPSSLGPVAPLLLRALEAERAGPLLPVADDDVGVGPRDAVPSERREPSGAAHRRGGRAAALRADCNERVLMRTRPVVPDDERGGRGREWRLLHGTSPELEHLRRIRE